VMVFFENCYCYVVPITDGCKTKNDLHDLVNIFDLSFHLIVYYLIQKKNNFCHTHDLPFGPTFDINNTRSAIATVLIVFFVFCLIFFSY